MGDPLAQPWFQEVLANATAELQTQYAIDPDVLPSWYKEKRREELEAEAQLRFDALIDKMLQ